jgi:hypothetical protein
VREGSKYQLLLRTSNLPGLVSTGKMIANEGGAITCKFNSFEEDNNAPILPSVAARPRSPVDDRCVKVVVREPI